ncbi:A-kinase anchor protein 28kDa [Cinara cedri]|uniref:A-kinase anchor protein 28kDa n=1 Tax=Cinara cedri TaxID=506608 RepID=A0A5E4MPX6_9HEMI|nr:A-kinase anchor protein 28kDa [Cinara cedri]
MESLLSSDDDKYDTNSSRTFILWKNFVQQDETQTNIRSSSARQHLKDTVYKSPRGLSENYLHLIRKTADNLVNTVIEVSESLVQNPKTLKPIRLGYNARIIDEVEGNEVTNKKNYIHECMDKLIQTSDSDHLLLSKLEWLDENGLADGFSAIPKISDYIKKNWALDVKYLFTIEKTNTLITNGLTRHSYKVEFSVPTKEHPIPQVTVSAYFTIDVSPLLSVPIYVTYQLETDRRVYVVGKHSFNRSRFERLFEIKRDAYMDINKKYTRRLSRPRSRNRSDLRQC